MRSLLSAALLLVLAGTAQAQANPQTREGFWISFGLGSGSLTCESCDDDDEAISGVGFNLRLGGTLSQRLLIGGEINGWGKEEGNVSVTIANITPVLLFYPAAQGGFFLKGGVGLAAAEVEWGPYSGEQTGVGITLGLGYDARVGRNFALTPYVDFTTSSFEADLTNETNTFNRISFGLGFTWP